MLGAGDAAMPVMNGGAGGEDYQQWMEGKVAQGKASRGEVYSNTLPVRKAGPAKTRTPLSKNTHTQSHVHLENICMTQPALSGPRAGR